MPCDLGRSSVGMSSDLGVVGSEACFATVTSLTPNGLSEADEFGAETIGVARSFLALRAFFASERADLDEVGWLGVGGISAADLMGDSTVG